MRPGKLDPALLDALLQALSSSGLDAAPQHDAPLREAEITLGPGPGRDAAVVRLPDRYLVLAADPVTFAESAGGVAPAADAAVVHVNANDVVCLGADPRWFLATILVPPETEEAQLRSLFQAIDTACRQVGATLVGGHTEVTDAVTRPVVAGTMIGDAPLDRLYASSDVRPGDDLIQIGPVAIEGTALLAGAVPGVLREAGLSAAEITQAVALAADPGISVVPAARAAWGAPGLHSLHDPTEGGIATACREMAGHTSAGHTFSGHESISPEAPGAGRLAVEIDDQALRVHPLTARIAAALSLDWRGLLASGALLAAVDSAHSGAFLQRLNSAGHAAARIGRFTAAQAPDASGSDRETAILRGPEGTRALPRFARDEALRVLTPDA